MHGFERRLHVKPGLTGLAQIYDKIDDPNEKYRYDMEYLQNLSPFLDARLIIMSVWNTLIARWDQRSGKVNLDDRKHGYTRRIRRSSGIDRCQFR